MVEVTSRFGTPMVGLYRWGFPKIRVPFLGVPIIRTIIFRGHIGVPLFWETTRYHLRPEFDSVKSPKVWNVEPLLRFLC